MFTVLISFAVFFVWKWITGSFSRSTNSKIMVLIPLGYLTFTSRTVILRSRRPGEADRYDPAANFGLEPLDSVWAVVKDTRMNGSLTFWVNSVSPPPLFAFLERKKVLGRTYIWHPVPLHRSLSWYWELIQQKSRN